MNLLFSVIFIFIIGSPAIILNYFPKRIYDYLASIFSNNQICDDEEDSD